MKWWIIWIAVTLTGFVLAASEFLIGYVIRYIGIVALIIMAIEWLNSTNRDK